MHGECFYVHVGLCANLCVCVCVCVLKREKRKGRKGLGRNRRRREKKNTNTVQFSLKSNFLISVRCFGNDKKVTISIKKWLFCGVFTHFSHKIVKLSLFFSFPDQRSTLFRKREKKMKLFCGFFVFFFSHFCHKFVKIVTFFLFSEQRSQQTVSLIMRRCTCDCVLCVCCVRVTYVCAFVCVRMCVHCVRMCVHVCGCVSTFFFLFFFLFCSLV